MSNGDDEDTAEEGEEEQKAAAGEAPEDDVPEDGDGQPEASEAAEAGDDEVAPDEPEPGSVEAFEQRLDRANEAVEEAETEDDLDRVEETVDDVAADVEAADLPEPDEADEDVEDPAEALEDRIEEVRASIEDARGPYAEDAAADVESAAETVTDTRWTDDGLVAVRETVDTFLEAAGDQVEEVPVPPDEPADPDAMAETLEAAADAVDGAGLDADEDAETVATLVDAAETLVAALDDAEEWDDLSVRQKLDAQGFYDRLTPENRKDFPPELTAIRVAEAEHDPEPILLGLEYFEAEFMVENCIDALRRMGPPAAFEQMHERAQKRDRPAVEVLGKIGDDRAVETLVEFIQDESNPPLQKTTLRALGEIGSEEGTQAVANRLDAEDPEVRAHAARALGRIGDARAVDPLADTVATAEPEAEADEVRGAAAWALVSIGTEAALEAAAEHVDDRAYLVQHQAEVAAAALGDDEATTTTA